MTDPLLAANGLRRSYRARRGSSERVRALDGVDLSVEAGGALGVVGATGAGKSTLVRLLLALEPPDEGTVSFDGHIISHLPEARIRPLRRRFQAVFQALLRAVATVVVFVILLRVIAQPGVADSRPGRVTPN